jgi:hypothetical protein
MNIIRNYAFLDRFDERNVLSYAFCFDFYKALTVLNDLDTKTDV